MEALLAQLADVGGPAFLLLLVFRFFPQFALLLDRAREFAGEMSDRAKIFASRTTVIIVRPIWWIILPISTVAALISSVSAFIGAGDFWWWATLDAVENVAPAAGAVSTTTGGEPTGSRRSSNSRLKLRSELLSAD